MEGIHVHMLYPRLVRPFPCVYQICGMGSNPSMATCTSYDITHLPGDGLVVANPAKSGPIALVVCGMDGGYPCVCVASESFNTIPMLQQDLREKWQPIHNH